MDAPSTAGSAPPSSPETQSIAGGASTLIASDFESESPTAVIAYRTLADEAAAWRAEFEQRGQLTASLARGTREWVRK